MKIHVLHSYRGRPSKELEILPGEYDAADPLLFGLAEYLLTNGHAEVVEDAASAESEATPLEDHDDPKSDTGEDAAPTGDKADAWDKPNPPEQPIPVSRRTKKVQ